MFTENKGKYIVDTVKNMACLIVDIKGEVYICTPWKNVGQLSDALISAMSDRGLITTLNANTVSTAPNYEIVAESPFTNDGGGGGGGGGGGTPGTTVIIDADMTIDPESQGFSYHPSSNNPITSNNTNWVTPAGMTMCRYELPALATENILKFKAKLDMFWSSASSYGICVINMTKNGYANAITVWDEGSQNIVAQTIGVSQSAPRPQIGAIGNDIDLEIRLIRLTSTSVRVEFYIANGVTPVVDQTVTGWDIADTYLVQFTKWQDTPSGNIKEFTVTKVV